MTDVVPLSERNARDQRLHEWVLSCLGKHRFESPDRADIAVNKAKRRRRVALRHYYCRHCGGWHLTKRTD